MTTATSNVNPKCVAKSSSYQQFDFFEYFFLLFYFPTLTTSFLRLNEFALVLLWIFSQFRMMHVLSQIE